MWNSCSCQRDVHGKQAVKTLVVYSCWPALAGSSEPLTTTTQPSTPSRDPQSDTCLLSLSCTGIASASRSPTGISFHNFFFHLPYHGPLLSLLHLVSSYSLSSFPLVRTLSSSFCSLSLGFSASSVFQRFHLKPD